MTGTMPTHDHAQEVLGSRRPGDGVKQVYPGELAAMKKLCRVPDLLAEDPQPVPVS